MKIGYTAISKDGEKVEFYAHSTETATKLNTFDAQTWLRDNVENHFNWKYYPNGKFKFD